MDASEFQQAVTRTHLTDPGFVPTPQELMLLWDALGLAGEAGELAEVVKKGVLHRHGLDRAKARKEIGDNCWYLAALCLDLGVDLSEIMAENIEKLRTRYPNGFSPEASMKRIDVEEL